jgi:hypothetical protein
LNLGFGLEDTSARGKVRPRFRQGFSAHNLKATSVNGNPIVACQEQGIARLRRIENPE